MKQLIILSVFLGAFVLSAKAQCDACVQALQKDIIYLDFSSYSDENLLNIVDERNYEEKKQEVQNQKNYEATYKIYSAILSESKDYREFNQKRESHFNLKNFRKTTEESIKFFEQKMSSLGYSSFDNCINICNGKPGLYLKVTDKNEVNVSFILKYIAPITDPAAVLVIDSNSVSVINGKPLSAFAKKLVNGINLVSGGEIEFTVKKNNNIRDLRIEINAMVGKLAISKSLNVPPMFQYKKNITERIATVDLGTNEPCNSEGCKELENISKVEILEFEAAGRTTTSCNGIDCREAGFKANKQHPSFNSLSFGPWRNENCHLLPNMYWQGNGWHCDVGSCCCGGNQAGLVTRVKANVTYREFSYVKEPIPCNE